MAGFTHLFSCCDGLIENGRRGPCRATILWLVSDCDAMARRCARTRVSRGCTHFRVRFRQSCAATAPPPTRASRARSLVSEPPPGRAPAARYDAPPQIAVGSRDCPRINAYEVARIAHREQHKRHPTRQSHPSTIACLLKTRNAAAIDTKTDKMRSVLRTAEI